MFLMKLIRVIVYYLIFLFTAITLRAQAPVVDISNEKVIVAGSQYYVHNVKKGQTAYSISKTYGVSILELNRLNPESAGGLKEGQVLRIPVVQVPSGQSDKNVPKDESKYVYHRINPGETVYSLSKLYGVSESSILQSNQGIEINKLSVGSEIKIPKKDFMNPKESFAEQDTKYYYHKVEKGETLSSIARKYKMTLRELRRENRDMRFPQVGDYVKIPLSVLPQEEQVVTEEADTVMPDEEEPVIRLERPLGYTPVENLKGTMDIAVMLPFFLPENSRSLKDGKPGDLADDWIYPQSLDFVEMYNGILLAADTLSSLGLNITIHTFDIKGDTLEVNRLINRGTLDNMDLIIGPVYSSNLQIVSRYAGRRGIPVVSPVSLINNAVLDGNQTTFMANPSLEVAQKALAGEIGTHTNSNLIFIRTDTSRRDPEVNRYRQMILEEFHKNMTFNDISFKELIFYPRSAFGNDSINRIGHSISYNRENIIIIANENPPVVSEILTSVYSLSKRHNLRVYGYPSMIYLDNLDPKIYFEMDQIILSPYKIDYSDPDVKSFNLRYHRKFLTMPPETSYAWIGYDIAYFFISGLSIHGNTFINHPEIHYPKLLQNEFVFEREDPADGFENQKLFKIRYSKDYTVVY